MNFCVMNFMKSQIFYICNMFNYVWIENVADFKIPALNMFQTEDPLPWFWETQTQPRFQHKHIKIKRIIMVFLDIWWYVNKRP